MLESSSAYLNELGNRYFSRGYYTEAYRCYIRALEFDRRGGDCRAVATTMGNLGNICAVSGRREQAHRYYLEVLELQKILGDDRGIGATLANLGNLCVDAGEWERGRAYYLEALDMMNRAGDIGGKAVLLSDLGLVSKDMGEFDRALSYYDEALRLMRQAHNIAGQADVYRMIARLYLAMDCRQEALACARTSLAMAERLHDEFRVGGAQYVLAECFEDLGQIAEAIECLTLVVRIDRKFRLPKLQENTARLEALIQRQKSQPTSAQAHRSSVPS